MSNNSHSFNVISNAVNTLALALSALDLSDSERALLAAELDDITRSAETLESESVTVKVERLVRNYLEEHANDESDAVTEIAEEELGEDLSYYLATQPTTTAVDFWQWAHIEEMHQAKRLAAAFVDPSRADAEDYDSSSLTPFGAACIEVMGRAVNWYSVARAYCTTPGEAMSATLLSVIDWREVAANLCDPNTEGDDESRRSAAAEAVAAFALSVSAEARDLATIQERAEKMLAHLSEEMLKLGDKVENDLRADRELMADQIEAIRDNLEASEYEERETCPVRLQVEDFGPTDEDGLTWCLHYGDPGNDQDHHGAWGASGVSPTNTEREEILLIVDDLISDALESISQSEDRAQDFEPPAWQLVLSALEEISAELEKAHPLRMARHPARVWARNWTRRNK